MKIQFNSIIIEADSISDIQQLISLLPSLSTFAPAKQVRQAGESVEAQGEPNVELCEAHSGKRFRLTKEETAMGLNREAAAVSRLRTLGIEPIGQGVGNEPESDVDFEDLGIED